MRRIAIVGGVCLAALVSVPDALAQKPKPPKCVNPSLSVVVGDTLGLAPDTGGAYIDNQSGVYAKLNSCGATGDIVLSLDLLQRQMALALSDGDHAASRVDVTGVESVTSGCQTRSATIWFGDPNGGFVRFNSPDCTSGDTRPVCAADTVQVCRVTAPAGAQAAWTVQPSSSPTTAARFKLVRGKYTYFQDEVVPLAITISQITP